MDPDLIAIVGPTASGKTRKAVALAEALHGEIISCDSRQVYRNMDIGTGKDISEYGTVPYHLIDIRDAGYQYNLHEFLSDYYTVLEQVQFRGNPVILCGGTGMYAEAVLSGMKLPEVPENPTLRKNLSDVPLDELTSILRQYKQLHNKTDVDTCQRAIRAIEIEEYYREHPDQAQLADKSRAVPPRSLIIGVDIPRLKRRERITARLHQRIQDGMIEEVKSLLDKGLKPDQLIYYGLEYKFVTQYLIGEFSKEEMTEKLEIAIHQFAKRQMTWYRGMERRGFKINWLPFDMPDAEFVDAVRFLL